MESGTSSMGSFQADRGPWTAVTLLSGIIVPGSSGVRGIHPKDIIRPIAAITPIPKPSSPPIFIPKAISLSKSHLPHSLHFMF